MWNVYIYILWYIYIGAVYCIAFSDDGKYMATASHDETVNLIDIISGIILHKFDKIH